MEIQTALTERASAWLPAAGVAPAEEVRRVFERVIQCSSADKQRARVTADRCVSLFEYGWDPDAAFRFSGLNADGCPIEISFSTLDRTLRYTTEVAGPELAHTERLSAACALASSLGHDPPHPALISRYRAAQASAPLTWGAALGVRHDGHGERLKFYLEVPAVRDASLTIREAHHPGWAIPPEASLLHHGCRLVMVGHNLSDGSREFYVRLPPLDRLSVLSAVRVMETDDELGVLLQEFAALIGMPAEIALQFVPLGYSFSDCARSSSRPVSLFVRSPAIRPERLREALCRHACDGGRFSRESAGPASFELPCYGVVSLSRVNDRTEVRMGASALALAALPRLEGLVCA